MSRNYTQVTTAIWLNDDFRALTLDAQWVYLMLISQPDITSIGSLPMTLKRWASYAYGMTIKRLSSGITELENHRFVVVDRTVEELLVRSFVRWDGGFRIPKRLEAIKAAAMRLNSSVLQQVAGYELTQLGIIHTLPGEPIDSLSKGYREDIDSSGVVVMSAVTSYNPQPTTINPCSGGYRKASGKGTRMTPDWQPSPRLVEFVRQECPAVNGRTETDQFRDWWISRPGKDGLKLDWDATYRNWMRKSQEERRGGNGRLQSPSARTNAATERTNESIATLHRLKAAEQNGHQPRALGIEQ